MQNTVLAATSILAYDSVLHTAPGACVDDLSSVECEVDLLVVDVDEAAPSAPE